MHPSNHYDRSPIVVDKNYSCALPARGCPGRTFMDTPHSTSTAAAIGAAPDTLHPRALFATNGRDGCHYQQQPQQQQYHPISRDQPPVSCPELCSSSSESDESSDGFSSPTPDLWSYVATPKQPAYEELSFISTTPTQDRPLSFLPHPNPHSPGACDTGAPDVVPTRRPRFRKDGNESTKRAATPKPRKACRVMTGLGFGGANEECLGGF